MPNTIPKSTSYITILGHKFCPYCYAELQHESGIECQKAWESYYCNCLDAQLELTLSETVQDAQRSLAEHRAKRLDAVPAEKGSALRHNLWVKQKELEILSGEIELLDGLANEGI